MNYNSGQSILEVIVALAIFALIGAAMTSLATGGFVALQQGGEYIEATALAEEGTEAVRAIRDGAWNENIFSTSSVSSSSGRWIFNGEDTTETIGQYTRTISFDDVCRDGSDNITICPGSYTDLNSKQTTVTVIWNTRVGISNTVKRVAYITNWDSQYWVEDTNSDFTDGTFSSSENSTTLGDSDGAIILQELSLTVVSEGSEIDNNGGAFSISLSGTPVSGDLYIVFLQSGDIASTWTQTSGTTGWIELYDSSGGAVYYKQLVGSETPSFTSSSGSRSGSTYLKITGHENPSIQAPEVSSGATGDSNAPDPDSITPTGGPKDYLFIAVDGNTDGRRTVRSGPGGYSTVVKFRTGGGGAGATGGHAYIHTTSSSEDPGAFTLSKSAPWETRTIVVHPSTASPGYASSGFYISSDFDTGTASVFNIVEWTESVTNVACGASCDVRVQIRTAATQAGLSSAEWSGPEGKDGDVTDYFIDPSGELIHTDHNGDQWIRYRLTIDGNGTDTPIMEEIRINYQ